jgi:hypothetical protein
MEYKEALKHNQQGWNAVAEEIRGYRPFVFIKIYIPLC